MLKNSSPWILLIMLILFIGCKRKPIALQAGMFIERSFNTFMPGTYHLEGKNRLDSAVIMVEGENIELDFSGVTLKGSSTDTFPDQFKGVAVLIRNSKKVTIRNLKIQGYKVGIMAVGVDSLIIENCDFSYNYRQRLKSRREREDLSDWLSYHQNDQDEWLRYGAGIYLKNCKHPSIRNILITGGQNGIMMASSNDGLLYNNTISFNSGVGIGLYRSSRNRIMHNKLDWNVRGYSHNFYARGQDSAGILCYEQSNENIFAYNSATHSGDGFFLWAGQTTMDFGEGGCNDNIIFRNDFSYAPTNGAELTFSRNRVVYNRMLECRYGIWAGYSWQSLFEGNFLQGNEVGIAVEHGQENTFIGNELIDNEVGIQLWERETQPIDWGYSKNRDTDSKNIKIEKNKFDGTIIPLEISHSDSVIITANCFDSFETLLKVNYPNEATSFEENAIADTCQPHPTELAIEPIPDGMATNLPTHHPRGRKFILMDEWGPYNFKYPFIQLREIKEDEYIFLLLGPEGNWRLIGGEGFLSVNPKTGNFPATIRARRDTTSEIAAIKLEFVGSEVTDPFGRTSRKGVLYPFEFREFEKELIWKVEAHSFDDDSDPLKHYDRFIELKDQTPAWEEHTKELAYTWWGSPGGNVPDDRFAIFAKTSFIAQAGRYRLSFTSDDGIKVFLDGKLILDHWDVHIPTTEEVFVSLDKEHILEIQHFDVSGLACLGYSMDKIQ